MHTYYEGCIAIVARDYASFLSDAQIPVLEGVSEEDDSEEDLYWSTIELLRDPIAQTVNANRYATPSSSRCWGEAAQLDGKNYPVEKTEAEEWHSTKGCHQCIRQVILVIGLNSVPARLAKFSGHVGILPMPIHAAASKQDKRASCSKSNCKPRRCFTTAAACTCASTPQSYTRLLKTSTSKAFASSASEFVFLTVGCCLCLATHVQVCPGANDEAAAANAIRFKRNGPCEDIAHCTDHDAQMWQLAMKTERR